MWETTIIAYGNSEDYHHLSVRGHPWFQKLQACLGGYNITVT